MSGERFGAEEIEALARLGKSYRSHDVQTLYNVGVLKGTHLLLNKGWISRRVYEKDGEERIDYILAPAGRAFLETILAFANSQPPR